MIRACIGRIVCYIGKVIERTVRFFTVPYYKSRMICCGDNVYIGRHEQITWDHLSLGNRVYIGNNCYFLSTVANIYIGNNVMFGPGVTILGGDHRIDLIGRYMIDVREEDKRTENDRDVIIEDDVWCGSNVTILKGVTVGTGSVIGAGSVVVKDIPPYTIHVGSGDTREFSRFEPEDLEEHKRILMEKKEQK